MIRMLAFALLMTATFPCLALEEAYARVTTVESTYMPTTITFEVDTGTASCPAGHWLT